MSTSIVQVPWDQFVSFSRIPRLSRECIVTEKIDGSNAVISIDALGKEIRFGSRNRWVTPENDNFNFARWGTEHAEELLKLGPGRHYGEWYGEGIQRGYGLTEKRFALFNAPRWTVNPAIKPDRSLDKQELCPGCCSVVPILWQGIFCTAQINRVMHELRENGSYAAPGFRAPEGIVIFHSASRTLFKKTFENDESGKAE